MTSTCCPHTPTPAVRHELHLLPPPLCRTHAPQALQSFLLLVARGVPPPQILPAPFAVAAEVHLLLRYVALQVRMVSALAGHGVRLAAAGAGAGGASLPLPGHLADAANADNTLWVLGSPHGARALRDTPRAQALPAWLRAVLTSVLGTAHAAACTTVHILQQM